MNKKIFGVKISTFLTLIACFLVAILIWLIVKYNNSSDAAFIAPRIMSVLRG